MDNKFFLCDYDIIIRDCTINRAFETDIWGLILQQINSIDDSYKESTKQFIIDTKQFGKPNLIIRISFEYNYSFIIEISNEF